MISLRLAVKRTAQGVALALVSPSALLCGFGRLRPVYTFFAQWYALGPGLPGGYLRSAFYRLTLVRTSIDTSIHFGTVFVHPGATIASGVSVGSYCVVGLARIGEWTQIASHVEIPSGRKQHDRGADGQLVGSTDHEVSIGANCWIGASAIIMAMVGDGSTVGAGSVVVKDVPAGATVVGNPARIIRIASETAS